MSYFQWYASKPLQAALLNTHPLSQTYLSQLNRLDDPTKYIELAPPYSGCGVLRVETTATLILENKGTGLARVRMVIGVNNSNGSNKPLYPYLGVSHGGGDAASEYFTIAAGQTTPPFTLVRFDIVDNDLESDQPISGWPNWVVLPGAGKTIKPTLLLCGNNDTPSNPVWYRDVQMTLKVI